MLQKRDNLLSGRLSLIPAIAKLGFFWTTMEKLIPGRSVQTAMCAAVCAGGADVAQMKIR